jgi:dCMP deaminase
MPGKRPTWDEYFLDLARLVASRSTCLRRHVGAVLIRDRHILTTGYNGAPRGLAHCLDQGCLREENGIPSGERHELCRAIHAEANAIIQAALHGVSTAGATLYSTTAPCSICARMLINAGVSRVVYEDAYPDPLATETLQAAGVAVAPFRLPSRVGKPDRPRGSS